jgi:hypothetical protein
MADRFPLDNQGRISPTSFVSLPPGAQLAPPVYLGHGNSVQLVQPSGVSITSVPPTFQPGPNPGFESATQLTAYGQPAYGQPVQSGLPGGSASAPQLTAYGQPVPSALGSSAGPSSVSAASLVPSLPEPSGVAGITTEVPPALIAPAEVAAVVPLDQSAASAQIGASRLPSTGSPAASDDGSLLRIILGILAVIAGIGIWLLSMARRLPGRG